MRRATPVFFAALLGLLGCQALPQREVPCEAGACLDLLVNGTQFPYPLRGAPVALGARLAVTARRPVPEAVMGWYAESTDAAILRIDKQAAAADGTLSLIVTAIAEGEAALEVRDGDGALQQRVRVPVRQPDRAQVLGFGPLMVMAARDRSIEAAAAAAQEQLRVVVGGTGVYLVVYYHGDERLYGRGILEVARPAGIEAAVVRGDLETRATHDFLSVKPMVAGSFSLGLRANGRDLLTVPVAGVPPAEVAEVALRQGDETRFSTNEDLIVWAVGRDAQQRDVYGVSCTWKWDNVRQQRDGVDLLGDLYRYRFTNTEPLRLEAQCAGSSALRDRTFGPKLAREPDGTVLRDVLSTLGVAQAGCSVSGGLTGGAAPAVGLLLLLRLLSRRRQRGMRPTSSA